jgi:hypothetical protein
MYVLRMVRQRFTHFDNVNITLVMVMFKVKDPQSFKKWRRFKHSGKTQHQAIFQKTALC